MKTSRRSLFALVAGAVAALTARAKADQTFVYSNPDIEPVEFTGAGWRDKAEAWRSPVPQRGALVPMCIQEKNGTCYIDFNAPLVEQISTGYSLVPVKSPEGQAVLNSMAVNLRSDGTLRHRQHHPTDFPPHR